ncbi:GntR family transcriptional regulator [Sediminivirga luteola]|uniref:GntR family transcriptional regulator n=1 Tax=Sediminivirga luteola TaxID=1774748 RepID=A0A8J2TXK4_9MICO|nr:GntR family transcriptional regulator [Sediminivirga luteola]MCI2267121.1 GntR family transcriptional regulator [Sediminivirga luteola]GGA12019.1 GntR family transcriptional regulator [Sediminivirga luteola]
MIRQERLGDQLARDLRRKILGGELEPGHHLVEHVLAERYDVSRGPVREALKQLEVDGLADSVRQGYRVSEVTAEDIDELYMLRLALETLAVERARAKAADWSELERIVAGLHDAAAENSQSRFAQWDLRFHSFFYQAGGGKRLRTMWTLFEPTLAALAEINPHPADDLQNAAEDHDRIFHAIKDSGDDDAWRALLTTHLVGAKERLQQSMAAGRDPA